MEKFAKANYIKLGTGGEYEIDSIMNGILRFGWRGQAVADINSGNWELIKGQLIEANRGKPKQVATADYNALRRIALSTPDEVWIAFHQSKLFWCHIDGTVFEDETSKYRKVIGGWNYHDENGDSLWESELPGRLAALQGFRGTSCSVKDVELLWRVLSGTRSKLAKEISERRSKLAELLTKAIKELHWKDFETLVDLVFRASGWSRTSLLGQQAKGYDLELRESITGNRYVVQVKSRADKNDVLSTLSSLNIKDYERIFFVIHDPHRNLNSILNLPKSVEIIQAERLGELALNAGLAGWLEEKAG